MSSTIGTKKQTAHESNLREIERLNNDIVDGIIHETQDQLVIGDINFTGDMSKTIHETMIGDKHGVVIDSPYAVPVEFGMPHGIHVNYDSLLKWVKGKLLIQDEKEARDIAFKIWRKILNKGIAPTRFFKKGIKSFIAKHGTVTIGNSNPRQKKGNLDHILKNVKKANRFARKINRHINKFNRIVKRRN